MPPHVDEATDRPPHKGHEIEITLEMIEAEADVILCEFGGAELGGLISATDLASRVFEAMERHRM